MAFDLPFSLYTVRQKFQITYVENYFNFKPSVFVV